VYGNSVQYRLIILARQIRPVSFEEGDLFGDDRRSYRPEKQFGKHLESSLDNWKSTLTRLDNREILKFADLNDWDSQGVKVELDA
jgi:hypothetical protein